MRVLTHLAGDIHQPLHAADNADFGGNRVTITNRMCVEYGSSQPTACRLHTYWDTDLVKTAARGQSEEAAAAAWAKALGALPPIDSDQPADWARESWDLAKLTAYRFEGFACKVGTISFPVTDDYDQAGVTTVKRQIAVTGKRLARLLNATLGQRGLAPAISGLVVVGPGVPGDRPRRNNPRMYPPVAACRIFRNKEEGETAWRTISLRGRPTWRASCCCSC
jgi:hypothetical protein